MPAPVKTTMLLMEPDKIPCAMRDNILIIVVVGNPGELVDCIVKVQELRRPDCCQVIDADRFSK